MSVVVNVDVFDLGTRVEARALGGKYAATGRTCDEAVSLLRERLPLNEVPEEPEFRLIQHASPGPRE